MQPLIITCAITGAEVTRQDHPELPITPEEIAQAVFDAWKEGASIAHLHARDADGTPTQDTAIYEEIIREIRARNCDIIVQVSTGGAVGMSAEERMKSLDAGPEMATLTTGSVNFGGDIFANDRTLIETIAQCMQEKGVRPEFEIFDLGMINNALQLIRKGLVSQPYHFDFVMGVPGAIPAEAKHLLHLIDSLPTGATWTVAGIGRAQLHMAALAIPLGGHVRVGFEDNIFYSKGVLAQSNAQLVKRVVEIADILQRPIATPKQAREILGISPLIGKN